MDAIAALEDGALAGLGREWLMHGHLQDRVGVPLYLARAGREEMEQLAIDEWMAASPIYSRRMQTALAFAGDRVPTIFKNLQLDIGAPHQFLDFRYRIHDDDHGEFWLAHCGALMDVEPMGEDFVIGMCHHIEDPTFDATAGATNRFAQVRPLHRPPRRPADRHPHCHWTVTIDRSAPPASVHPNLAEMEESAVARLPIPGVARLPIPGVAGSGPTTGMADYSGPFHPGFTLEDLSRGTLLVALDEFALQSQLLFRSYLLSLSQRLGADDAVAIGHRVLVGWGALTAERLVRSGLAAGPKSSPPGPGPSPPGLGFGPAAASLLEVHPLLHPRSYWDLRASAIDESSVRLAVGPCPAVDETDPLSPFACLERFGPEPLAAIAESLDRRAAIRPDRAGPGERMAWLVEVDVEAEARPEPPELALGRISTGAAFVFRSPVHPDRRE